MSIAKSSMSLSISNGMQSISGKRAMYMDHAISALQAHGCMQRCACSQVLLFTFAWHYHRSCVLYSRLMCSQTELCLQATGKLYICMLIVTVVFRICI